MGERSKVIKHRGFHWEGVDVRRYKTDDGSHRDITRQTILGDEDDERALNQITRYFEIAPGGYSTLERHRHPHTVVVVRGRGTVVLDDGSHAIEQLDCVYVSPGTLHQFHASGDEPLGFLCIVDRDRDRPELPGPADLARLRSTPRVARYIKV